MIKRIFTIILALALTTSLLACGLFSDTPEAQPDTSDRQEDTSDATEETTSETDQERTPAPESEIPYISIDFFEYVTHSETDGVVILNYTGTDVRVRIPNEIDGMPVTVIGSRAFYDSGVMSVYIPDTVRIIGPSAFANTNIESVIIPGSVHTIREYAFYNCINLVSVTIEYGVEVIGAFAFARCVNLTSINIPNSVTTIWDRAFDRTGITNITIPDSVDVSWMSQARNLSTPFGHFSGDHNIVINFRNNTFTVEEFYNYFR